MRIEFLDKKDASLFISKEDIFILSLSDFDRSARLKTERHISKKEFLNFISNQTLNWNENERKTVSIFFNVIKKKIKKFKLVVPNFIKLIKTTGEEEGNAMYCRRNSIIFPQANLSNTDILENSFIHELFHILTRNNKDKQEKLYNMIGFIKCPQLHFPDELAPLKITNPDAPFNNFYIELKYNEQLLKLIPILYSEKPYNEQTKGNFFDYLQFKLLAVDVLSDSCIPAMEKKRLKVFSPHEIPEFFKKTGRNTNYIIHPEEILADNFVLLIKEEKNVRSPNILQEMRNILLE